MPFLRLTRDRRGFENTFLLHADHPGEKPRLLYWYRTAPGIVLGRSPLDEEAIRTIEDQHPNIDFDWPAILALSEVMTPEDEEPPRQQKPQKKPRRDRDSEPREARRDDRRDGRPEDAPPQPDMSETPSEPATASSRFEDEQPEAPRQAEPPRGNRLLEELVGREIAARLRGRYSEIVARIHEQNADANVRDGWLKRAEAINPELWVTPDAILEGVRNADKLFDQLKSELTT